MPPFDEVFPTTPIPEPISRRRRVVVKLLQLASEKTTIVAIVGAVFTLGGWTFAPDKLLAISTIVSSGMGVALVWAKDPT